MILSMMYLASTAFGQEEVTSPTSGKELRLAWAKEEAGGPLKPLTVVGFTTSMVGVAAMVSSIVPYGSLHHQAVMLQNPQGNFGSEAAHAAALEKYSATKTEFVVAFWGGASAYAVGMGLAYFGEIELPYQKWKRGRASLTPTASFEGGAPNFGVYGRF